MKDRIIGDAFLNYRELVISPNASETQVTETRRAFFAGAAVLFGTMLGWAGLPEDRAMELYKMLQDELDEYGAQLDLDVLGEGKIQ